MDIHEKELGEVLRAVINVTSEEVPEHAVWFMPIKTGLEKLQALLSCIACSSLEALYPDCVKSVATTISSG